MSADNSAAPHNSSAIATEAPLIVGRIASNLRLWISALVRKRRLSESALS